LKHVVPGLVTMKANAAFCFLLAGLALHLLQSGATKTRQLIARVLATVVLMVALVTLGEYLTGRSLGIDELLIRDEPRALVTVPPGRMALNTALCFIFVGLALLATQSGSRSHRVPRWLAAPTLLVSALALIGYAYGASSLYAMASYSPTGGFMEVLTSDTAGGITARRLLPMTTIIIFALGWIRLAGQQAGLYDTSLGLALMVSACILVTSGVVASHAWLLHHADVAHRGVEAEIIALNASLEQRVDERTQALRETLAQVRQLSGLLPMCAWCKKIRDDQEYWHSVEGYISAHSDARFSHGMCPECYDKMTSPEQATS